MKKADGLRKKSGVQRTKLRKDMEVMPLTDADNSIPLSIPKKAKKSESKKSKGVVQTHREEIQSLEEKDPEFFKFLAENDAQALGFGGDDEDDFSDADVEDGENLDLHSAGADDEDGEFFVDVGTGAAEVTMELLRKVIESSVRGQMDSIRKLIKIFSAACIPSDSAGEGDEDEDNNVNLARKGFVIPSADVYNEIMVQVLGNAHIAFKSALGLPPNGDVQAAQVKTNPKWKRVQLIVLSFFKSVLHLLNKFSITQQDDQIVAYLIEKLESYICFLVNMPRLSKATLKALLAVWCQDVPEGQSSANSRGHAFLRIMQMAKTLPGAMLEECFRSMYLTFSRNSKTFTESTAGTVLFMTESVAALYSIDIAIAYQQAFLYIRQLALHLRAALAKKSGDAVKLIASWQYLNCVRLWTKVICSLPAKSQLGELGFPLIQIIMGVLASCTSPYHFPLRFHLMTCLHQLSASCQVFIPTATIVLDVLDNADLFAKPSASTELAPNLRYLVKLPTDSLNRANVRDSIVSEAITLLSHDAELCRYNVGFPEYSFLTIKRLRAFAKKTKISKWRDLTRALISQLEGLSSSVKTERVKTVMNGPLPSKFEQLLPPNALPVAQRLSKLLASRIANSVSLSASSVKLDAFAGQKRAAAGSSTKKSSARGGRSADSDNDSASDEEEDEVEDDDEEIDERPKKSMKATKESDNKKKQQVKEKSAKKQQQKAQKNKDKSRKGSQRAGGDSGSIEGISDTVDTFSWSDSDNE